MGYSLVKGIGDGEPIASERFTVGGHEWVSGCSGGLRLQVMKRLASMACSALVARALEVQVCDGSHSTFVSPQVLLFYPDGKRSSSSDAAMDVVDGGVARIQPPQPGGARVQPPQPAAPAAAPGAARPAGEPNGNAPANPPPPAQQLPVMRPGMAPPVPLPRPGAGGGNIAGVRGVPALPPPGQQQQQPAQLQQQGAVQQQQGQAQPQQQQPPPPPPPPPPQQQPQPPPNMPAQLPVPQPVANDHMAMVAAHNLHPQAAAPFNVAPPGAGGGGGNAARRETEQYAALFVALIGEGAEPQGVVSTSDGRVVRAFHRFTLVDQSCESFESASIMCHNSLQLLAV